METEKLLADFGLTENEITVYLKLLSEGESTASRVAKLSGMDRHIAYDVVSKLAKKGFVSQAKRDGKTYYKHTPVDKFLDVIRERKQELALMEKKFAKLVPMLAQSASRPPEGYDFNVLVGAEGFKAVLKDELRAAKPIFLIGTTPQAIESRMKNYLPSYTRERVQKKIPVKVLTTKGFSFYEKMPLMDVRYLPSEFSSMITFSVYGDNVALVLLSEPAVILIRNRELAKAFQNHFKLLWSLASEKKK